jgi:hypothetical protein
MMTGYTSYVHYGELGTIFGAPVIHFGSSLPSPRSTATLAPSRAHLQRRGYTNHRRRGHAEMLSERGGKLAGVCVADLACNLGDVFQPCDQKERWWVEFSEPPITRPIWEPEQPPAQGWEMAESVLKSQPDCDTHNLPCTAQIAYLGGWSK